VKKTLLLLALLLLLPVAGCASFGSWAKGLVTFKAADKIQAAEKITGVEKLNAKVADKAEANVSAQIGQTVTSEKTEAGRDISTSTYNDTKVMERYIALMKTFIYTIVGIAAAIISALSALIGALIAGLVYCLKYMLESERMEQEEKR
jgi:hypothetical protein